MLDIYVLFVSLMRPLLVLPDIIRLPGSPQHLDQHSTGLPVFFLYISFSFFYLYNTHAKPDGNSKEFGAAPSKVVILYLTKEKCTADDLKP